MDARELRWAAGARGLRASARRKGAPPRRKVESIIFLLVLLSFAARSAELAGVVPLRSFGRLLMQFA